MPITQGEGSTGGGGSTSNVCSINPQDQVGSVENILSRLTAIETILSQLLGTDITAIQLSDITQDMGSILGGSFGGGVLADIATSVGQINAWMTSAEDNIIEGQSTTGIYGMGAYREFTLSGSINAFTGVASSVTYRYDRGTYDGGFLYESRIAFIPGGVATPGDANDILPNVRFFAGLGNGLFRNFAGNNSDNPPTTYIVFSYSKPRGDATFKIMLNGKSDVLAAPSSAAVIDTGMPITTRHWYEFKMRCEPGAGSITWSIDDLTANISVSGAIGTPAIYREPILDPFTGGHVSYEDGTYEAGYGMFNCSIAQARMSVHHGFAQILDVLTGQ